MDVVSKYYDYLKIEYVNIQYLIYILKLIKWRLNCHGK